MLTKENEAKRFNDGKVQFSLIDFTLFKDMYKYFPLIENINTNTELIKRIINTLSIITRTYDINTHTAYVPILQGLGYRMALEHAGLKFYNSTIYDFRAFEDMARVLEYGVLKYDRNNWKKGYENRFNTADSLYRHLRQIIIGEDLDGESGISHIGHIMCNIMILTNDLLIIDRENE